MRVRTRTRTAHLSLLYGSVAVLAACVSAGSPDLGGRPSRSATVITEGEIAESHATTAYEAIERTHPVFLTSKINLAPLGEREVYLNGIRLGRIAELRGIPSSAVREIRFVRGVDAAAFGMASPAGAILVISKAGR